MRVCPAIFESSTKNIEKEFEVYPFELDHFQKYSIEAIYNGHNSLVTAHTGSGKTLPAEYAINHFCSNGKKVIYTSPIKSLSNQKYHEFSKQFPHISFGIYTGDIKFNPDADCIIMTTEILRNILYNLKSDLDDCSHMDIHLDNLGCVVFDEVHYINDQSRGKVWEESIMLIPQNVQMVMLSATIDKIELFAQWLDNIKEKNIWLSTTEKRVVPLVHYSFFSVPDTTETKLMKHVHTIGDINNKLMCIKKSSSSFIQRPIEKINKIQFQMDKYNYIVKNKFVLNSIISILKKEDKLPAICFVFSRKKAELFAHYIETNLHDITEEGYEDDRTVQKKTSTVKQESYNILKQLSNKDDYLETYEYENTLKLLEKGIAVHHSGILPIIREMIEILFSKGYIKLLFATETFSVGINMPTKTVLFTSLYKFDGTNERPLLPHEYTQMAGRAGRRGLDTIGHVIHLNNMFEPNTLTTSQYCNILCGKPQHISSKFTLDFGVFSRFMRTQISSTYLPTHEYIPFNINDIIDYVKKSYYYRNHLLSEITYLEKSYNTLEIQLQELCNSHIFLDELNKEFIFGMLDIYDNITTSISSVQNNNKHFKKYKRKQDDIIEKINVAFEGVIDLLPFDELYKILSQYYQYTREYKSIRYQLENKKHECANTLQTICLYLQTKQYINIDFEPTTQLVNNVMFTKKGVCLSYILEINPFIFSELYMKNYFNNLTTNEIILLFSCFTSIKIQERHKINKYLYDDNLSPIMKYIEIVKDTYYHDEINIKGHVDEDIYWFHYDLVEGMYNWIHATTNKDCKEILSSYYEYGVMQGEFIKSILKINAISLEIQEFCKHPDINDVGLMNKCSEIPNKLLKFIATNESLYVTY